MTQENCFSFNFIDIYNLLCLVQQKFFWTVLQHHIICGTILRPIIQILKKKELNISNVDMMTPWKAIACLWQLFKPELKIPLTGEAIRWCWVENTPAGWKANRALVDLTLPNACSEGNRGDVIFQRYSNSSNRRFSCQQEVWVDTLFAVSSGNQSKTKSFSKSRL